MNLIAQVALIIWPVIVVIIFGSMSPKRAVIAVFVTAWLALPMGSFGIPGLPDYNKMSATTLAVLLCLLLFDTARIFTIRFRWYDIPMLVWCLTPFPTAMLNDLGPYEGLAASLFEIFMWGLPYLIGRLYLTDLNSIRDLCLGIVIGGLAYIPLCLIELRFSPQLSTWIYGISRWDGERYGGYRPKVFLQHGLQLGHWMTIATLIGYQIWVSGAVKRLRGFSFGWLVVFLTATTILCKSTGALTLLLMGLGALQLSKMTKRSWPVWLLLCVPLFYCSTRTLNLWSGMEVSQLARMTVGEDRALSFEYRLNMENMLAVKALEQPVFGWGRMNRSSVVDKQGRVISVQDGFWIIALGYTGILGLSALVTVMILPMILTIRRFPASTWSDPRVAPLVVLSVTLVLTMIDFLSNAMLNPLYALLIGGLLGQTSVRLSGGLKEAEAGLIKGSELMSQGLPNEAAQAFHGVIVTVADGDDIQGRQIHAVALDGLGHSLAALGRIEEAEHAFRDGLMVRDWLAAHNPDAGRFRDLAIAREGLARLFAETGRPIQAVEERQIALKIWDILVGEHPKNTDYRHHRVASLNDLAWILATEPDPRVYDPSQALMLAEEAVRSSGDHEASWNTLGVARYRVGDWAGAIEALERSALASLDGRGTAWDHYYLSMAWCRLQNEGLAREWLERGVAWTARHQRGHPTLERFRDEAEALLRSETGQASLEFS